MIEMVGCRMLRKTVTQGSLMLCTACAVSLIQQSVMAAETTALETVTVTATRSQQKQTKTPASVGTKTAKETQLDAPILQKDLFNSIAGVRITQTGSILGHMTSIRMPTNTAPYYLILQDGIPVQSSGFFNHNALAYTNYETANKAEVLKGAGTALYGSDAVAATINVISKEPSPNKTASVKTEVGSDGFYRMGVKGNNKVGKQAVASLDYSHAESDGWRENTQFKRDEVTLKHLAELTNGDTLKTTVAANQSQSGMAGYIIGKEALAADPSSVGDIAAAVNTGLPIERKFDFSRISSEWDHQVNEKVAVNSIAYVRNNRNRYATTWESTLPLVDNKTDTLGVMAKATVEQGNTQWIAGLDAEKTKSNNKAVQDVRTATAKVPAGTIYDYAVDYTAVAPYVQAKHSFNEQWTVGAGVRHDVNHFDYTNKTADGIYGSSTYYRVTDNNDPTYHHTSPKVDLSYKPTENQLVYARYANGFRIPQASQLYSHKTNNINTTTNAVTPLDPETTNTVELGYKVGNKKHQVETAIYNMDIDDTIVSRKNSDGISYATNTGKTKHRGIEVSLTSKLTDQVSTKLAYSYSKHHYQNDATYGDNEQAAAPRHVANARLNYTSKALPKLTTQLEVERVSSYWMDDANTKKYEGFTVGNVKASYQANKHLDLFAKVNNVTNKTYAETADYSYGTEKYTPAAPRQVFVGMEYNWE